MPRSMRSKSPPEMAGMSSKHGECARMAAAFLADVVIGRA